MVSIQDITTILVPTVPSLAVLLWVLYDKRKSGVSDVQGDVTKYYQERRSQQDEKIKDQDDIIASLKKLIDSNDKRHGDEIAKITSDIAGFKATIIEKQSQIESLERILQGRNPEMVELLHKIEEALTHNMSFMQVMHEQNKGILDYQTRMLEDNQTRAEKIDTASIHHKGEPMRVPETTPQSQP